MLQQTQVERVIGPYLRWTESFPDPGSCASAGPAAALAAWHGLGYNRRALSLHRAALSICDGHGGRVPSDLKELRALPGIGPYTARAVMVFAFGAPVGVVDTNVRRVLSRVFSRRLSDIEAQRLADSLVPGSQSWAYNQALFDIGAAHCRARRPECDGCPLRPRCSWAASGWPEPDPGTRPTRQSPFVGSDRQGRGRVIAALLRGALGPAEVAAAAGWPDDPDRAARVAEGLVADGLARWSEGILRLP
jgi:A/G-specific adenine glycosylase